MAGHGYHGESDSDRALNKIEKQLKKIGKWTNKPTSLKEQLEDLENNTFDTVYETYGFWESRVFEHFLKLYHLSLDSRFIGVGDRFSENPYTLLKKFHSEKMLPKDAAKKLSNYCMFL